MSKIRLSRNDVDRFIKQTPCLCGDIETWHEDCYRGKSGEQVRREYARAYEIARTNIRARLDAETAAALTERRP